MARGRGSPVVRKASPRRTRRSAEARWNTRSKHGSRPRTVIVGVGRLGGALALRLKAAGWPVMVLPRSTESVRRAVQLNLQLADHEALKAAQLCVLCVPDGSIGPLAASILEDLGSQTALVHCAGALDLSVFGNSPELLKRVRGSFHPLVAVSTPTSELAGHAVAVAASDRVLMPVLWRLALALRMTPIEVPEPARAAYHAGAVLSAGLMVALADAAVSALELSGIEPDTALHALLPLMESALQGVRERGLARGLTGPITRGDVAVIEAHLAALPPDLGQLYRLLSLRALKLIEASLPQETRLALERLLRR